MIAPSNAHAMGASRTTDADDESESQLELTQSVCLNNSGEPLESATQLRPPSLLDRLDSELTTPDGPWNTPLDTLLLESDAGERERIEALLSARGHRVTACSDVDDLLNESSRIDHALAIVDLSDPNLSGLSVCQRLRVSAGGPYRVILAMTADTRPDVLQRVLTSGVDDYLVKPLTREYLDLRLAVHERTARDRRLRRKSEEQLRDSLDRFALISRCAGEGFWDWTPASSDQSAHTIRLSLRASVLLGLQPAESYELANLEQLVHPEDLERVRDAVRSHVQQRGALDAPFRLRVGDEEYRWFQCRGQANWNAAGQPVRIAGSIEDITDQKRIEERLHHAQKMEAIGAMAGGVAHDFNNLLTVIMGRCELLYHNTPDDDPRKPGLSEIAKVAEHAASLSGQLLAFGRRQELNPVILDLNSVVGDLEDMLRRVLGKRVELVLNLEPPLSQVEADEGQIWQILLNLVLNARDAMADGGRLVIETANVDADEPWARAHDQCGTGRYTMLSVSDTGKGMSPEIRDRVFEPFFTTKKRGQGVGLGLSTVHGVVKQSGGHIWVYSELGRGTTFKVYLPAVGSDVTTPVTATAERKPLGGEETLLLVEDNDEIREITSDMLEGHGYELLLAASGDEALRICSEREEPIDLLLTDVVMPGLSGPDIATCLREKYPDLRTIYVSGHSASALEDVDDIGKQSSFLQKPFSAHALLTAVRSALDGERD